jgi:predicted ATPase/DNA-binding SARP family transcriptional activator
VPQLRFVDPTNPDASYNRNVLTFSVLGPVEVRRDEHLLTVPAGKTSEVLVRLALEAGSVVRADRLVDDLWGDEAVGTRRNTLQSKIVKLRRALGDSAVVTSAGGGYCLSAAPEVVDALVVPANLATVASLIDAGDDAGAADLCAATRALFRGDLLIGGGDGEWLVPHRARLEAAHLQLIELECACRLRLGQIGDVIGDLEVVVAEHPFQESLWVLLMTALYRAGQQADALAASQRVRSILSSELGLEPGPQLRQVEERILAHDPGLRSIAADPLPATVGNLPTLVADLVGRRSELSQLGDLIDRRPLVEILGPGGIGKTALAIAVAQRSNSRGGAWLARLETTSTADEVVDAVIAALGVTGGASALFERLKTVDTLIVLDNCEHVLDPVAELVQRLLDHAPGTKLLCTSQAALRIEGSTEFELEPLDLVDAVELFTRRSSPKRGEAPAGESEHAVREVCRALDGLPLAIELAAARTKTLSVAEIGRRLDDRFEVLSDPTSRRPARRRALRATIGWSYELLFADDQRGLWALATFVGGATLEAIEHVLGALDVPPRTAIDVVGRLANRSLLIVDSDPADQTRYRLLDSIRAYALEAMAEAGASDVGFAANAAWLAAVAHGSSEGTRSADQAAHLAVAKHERANVDAALAWCARNDPLLGVQIANGFGWAWVVLGDSRGAQRVLTALDAGGSGVPVSDRITALLLAGWFEASIGDLGPARDHVLEAAALAEASDDAELIARSAYYLAYVVSHDGDFRAGLELTDRSRALFAGLDCAWDVAANSLFATRAAISAGDEQRAVVAADLARDALAMVDDPWLHVRYEAMVGELARLQHRFDDAVAHIASAAAASHRLGFLQTEAYQVASLGRAQCQAGDYESGSTTLELAVAKAEATGDVRMAALARVHLGRVRRALGDLPAARATLEQTVAWHREAGGGEQAVLGECLLAALDARDGVADAPARLASILDWAVAEDNAAAEVLTLDALARIAADAGDDASARSLAGRAAARMVDASHFIAEPDRVDSIDAVGR